MPPHRRIPIWVAAFVLCLGATAAPATGQVFVEGRVGTTAGNHEPAASEFQLQPRLAYSGIAGIHLVDEVGIYGGFNVASFRCAEGFCTEEPRVIESRGPVAGIVLQPVPALRLRGGVVHNTVVVDGVEGAAGTGLEVSVDLDLPVTGAFALRPGVTYRLHGGGSGGVSGKTAFLGVSIGFALVW